MAALERQNRTWPPSPPRTTRLSERHPRGRLGFVLLQSEETAEDDIRMVVPADVGVFFTRSPMPDSTTVETLASMGGDLGRAAGVLPPALDAVAYVCTSGSVVIGEERVAAELTRGQPQARTTSLVSCVVAALKTLGIARPVVGTPYLDEINTLEADFLTGHGFDVFGMTGMQIESGWDMCRVDPDDTIAFALEIDRPEADGIFLSCTGLRTLEVVEEIERRTGKPVLGSNQALIWRMLRLIGVDDRIEGYGRLLREH